MGQQIARFAEARLPYHPGVEQRFAVDQGQWRALVEAIFPSAQTAEAVVMALAYCKARNLDIFKKPVAIVPVWDSKKGGLVETVWPTIAEVRITAARTGEYAGCEAIEFGDEIDRQFTGKVKAKGGQWEEKTATVIYPEWGQMTVYRIVKGVRCAFLSPKVYWAETYGRLQQSEVPNSMWAKRPFGQFEKCVEAAALRRAFPEEIGAEPTAEEMEGQILQSDIATPPEKTITPPPIRTAPVNGAKASATKPETEQEHHYPDEADAQSPDELIAELENVVSGIESIDELNVVAGEYYGHPALTFPPDMDRAKKIVDERREAIAA